MDLERLMGGQECGDIWAEHVAEGQGICFVMRLPRYASQHEVEETQPTLAERHRGWRDEAVLKEALMDQEEWPRKAAKTSISVLIVEDDKEICDYMRRELSELYRVSVCHNGQDAYEAIVAKQPDLVVSDVMMPKMDGMELCKRIRANITINHLPIILLTARTKAEDKVEGMHIGADAYLTKPFSMEVLKSTIDGLIQNRHLLKTKYSGSQEQREKPMAIEMQTPKEQ